MFPTALKSGKRFSSEHLSIVLPKEGMGYAVIVPKKVARLSVMRHRIKRRVFAALRTLPLPSSLIVFPRASAGSVSYKDIQMELSHLLSNKNY